MKNQTFIRILCDLFVIIGLVSVETGLFLWLGKALALVSGGALLMILGIAAAYFIENKE